MPGNDYSQIKQSMIGFEEAAMGNLMLAFPCLI